jgi:hypothetical protein
MHAHELSPFCDDNVFVVFMYINWTTLCNQHFISTRYSFQANLNLFSITCPQTVLNSLSCLNRPILSIQSQLKHDLLNYLIPRNMSTPCNKPLLPIFYLGSHLMELVWWCCNYFHLFIHETYFPNCDSSCKWNLVTSFTWRLHLKD